MSGAAQSLTNSPLSRPLRDCAHSSGGRLPGHEVDAAGQGAPDVLVAPHHALRVAGGAAGVDDVHVVGAAGREVACAGGGGQRGVVVRGAAGFAVRDAAGFVVRAHRERQRAVVDLHQAAQAGHGPGGPGGPGHDRGQTPVVHQRDRVRVRQHVLQLVVDVAVVDVDGGRAQLARREQRLDRLDRVAGVQADVITGADPEAGQVMSQPVGTFLQLAVGQLPVAAGHRGTFGEGVRGMLEEVGEVQGHGNESRTCYCSGQAFGHGRNEERYARGA